MKLYSLSLKNFRGYREETTVCFDDLTAIVGKNDVGKSSILEALDIFCNSKPRRPIEKTDLNVDAAAAGETDIEITAEFVDFPGAIVIDATNETSLADEFLLSADGRLKVKKVYPNGGKEKVYIIANHPTQKNCSDLITLKQSSLKKCVEDLNLDCDKTKNAEMRKAIREYYQQQTGDLCLREIPIEAAKENVKDIWSKLCEYLPVFSLFVSDRDNNEGDKMVQDPLKFAVQRMFSDEEIQRLCHQIAERVIRELQDVATGTLAKLHEMNAEIANQLNPSIWKRRGLKMARCFQKCFNSRG